MSTIRTLSAFIVAVVIVVGADPSGARSPNEHRLLGSIESDGTGLEGYRVTLMASFGPHGRRTLLGRTVSGPDGVFELSYRLPHQLPSRVEPVIVVRAKKGPRMLVSAIGQGPVTGPVVVNERTTVATGFAFAQFVDGKAIKGNRHGVVNAVRMAGNMANVATGLVGQILDRSPNGPDTSARKTFNSLANIVAACIASASNCEALFDATTLPGEEPTTSVLQAVANIAKYPWSNVDELFALSLADPVYGPALAATEEPDAWTLFLKFTGSFSSEQNVTNLMNGPGAFAIDKKGFLWVNDNYVPIEPSKPACTGRRLLKFSPQG